MKRAPTLLILSFLAACSSSGTKVPEVVVARFDPAASPAVVPAPNDLAADPTTGLLVVPVAADASDAMKELAAYLDTLNGFPPDTDATTDFDAPLDPATVTLDSVRIYDVTRGWERLGAGKLVEKPLLYVEDPDDAAAPAQLVIRPPVGGWTAGHSYAIALVGGTNGIRGAHGEPLVGSLVFQLARMPSPLAVCSDGQYHAGGTYPACQATSQMLPSEVAEPEAKAADQASTAMAAEALRLRLRPVLDHLEADGVQRSDVAVAWSFKVTDQTTARFDPTAGVLPTPTDLVADAATGLLSGIEANLPASASAADLELAKFLATLDGYPKATTGTSTFKGKLDPQSLVLGTTVRIVDVTAGDAEVLDASLTYDAASDSMRLRPPAAGWQMGHSYGVALVGGAKGIRDEQGRAVIGSDAWALMRSRAALVTCTDAKNPDCKATLDVFPAASAVKAERVAEQFAAAIRAEAVRLHYKPMLDRLEAKGLAREDVALAFSFRVTDQVSMALDPKAECPVAPSPNDLSIDSATGLVQAPLCSWMSEAYQELITSYLNTLDGFPTGATAHAPVANGQLDPATVTGVTVRVLDVTAAPSLVSTSAAYDSASNSLVIPSPAGGWLKGHRYAAVVVGGAGGVKDASAGKAVVATDVFALMRSAASLVTCEDLADRSCASTLTLTPVELSDLLTLEAARRALKPVFDFLEAGSPSLKRADIPMLWTFKIMSEPEFVFDPGAGVIPFPNAVVYDAAQGHVALPTAGLTGAQLALVQGLNGLDGFSTTAPVVSENAAGRGAIDVGSVDAATLAGHAAMLNLSDQAKAVSWTARVQPASAQAPEQLQFSGPVPLDEATQYAAYLTTDVRNADGKTVRPSTVFAMMRLAHPLVDQAGNSLVPDVSSEQARQLEALRAGHAPLLQGLAAAGISREKLGLVWSFKTQSTLSRLKSLHALPSTAWAGSFEAAPAYVVNATTSAFSQMDAASMPHDEIDKVFAGRLVVPWALTGAGGTLNPAAPVGVRASFFLVTPKDSTRPGGFPVVVFQHDLQRQRHDALAMANALASAGFAVFAMDAPWHGDRTTCVGSGAFLSLMLGAPVTDDAACADPANQQCDAASGMCVNRKASSRAGCDPAWTLGVDPDLVCAALGQGSCVMADASQANWKCQAADFARTGGVPAISGWKMLDLANFFATRDSQRQYVVDLAQVERMLADSSLSTALKLQGAADGLDATSIHFVGQGLGAMLGTLYAAASPKVQRAVLNAPGTDVLDLVLGSPALAKVQAAWVQQLHGAGLDAGTPAFDQYLGFMKWISEAGAAETAALGLLDVPGLTAVRAVAVQEITLDEVVPNAQTDRLVGILDATGASQPALDAYSGPAPAAPDRHGFLLNGADPVTTGTAQSRAVRFLSAGSLR